MGFFMKKNDAPNGNKSPTDTSFPVNPSILNKNGVATGQKLRNNTSYVFSDSSEQESLRNAIESSLQQTNFPKDINWIGYATKNNEQVSLTDFSSAAEIKIDSRFGKFLDEYNYDRIVCKNSASGLDYGLVINNKLFDNYPSLQQEELVILKSWEPTMLKDLHKLLYPGTEFTEQELSQSLVFKNGKYRYTEVALPENKKGSLNYHVLVDSIFFATSLECMDQASQAIESIE